MNEKVNSDQEKQLVSNLKKFILEYPNAYKAIKLILLITCILIPVLIWFCYWIGHYYLLIPTDITAGELLSFLGILFTFLGTITLSILALWQNLKANQMNEKLIRLQMEVYNPYLTVTLSKVDQGDQETPDTTKSINWSRTMQGSKIIEMQYRLYWIIDKEVIDDSVDLNKLQKIRYFFTFKNESNAKVKRIILQQIAMECAFMYNWSMVPNDLHNSISQVILPNETFNFNIIICWDPNDDNLTKVVSNFGINMAIELKLITMGNNEQFEKINLNIWNGQIFEQIYEIQ